MPGKKQPLIQDKVFIRAVLSLRSGQSPLPVVQIVERLRPNWPSVKEFYVREVILRKGQERFLRARKAALRRWLPIARRLRAQGWGFEAIAKELRELEFETSASDVWQKLKVGKAKRLPRPQRR